MPDLSGTSLTTYRYLRLSIVGLIVFLAASVVIEWTNTTPRCFQTSISAYWYTPAQAVFVAALIAIGVCMVVLKGNTEGEDVLLNLAGMLAPVVALVPTPGRGGCWSVPVTPRETSADIANNVPALIVAGGLGLLVTAWFLVRSHDRDPRHVLGLAASATVLVGGTVWFVRDRSGFDSGAHDVAAIALFVCIVGVVVLNARGYGRTHRSAGRAPSYANRYLLVATLIVVSAVGMGAWAWLVGWDHAVLWIEGVLIVLFLVFWLIQTRELWEEGLREDPTGH